MKKENKKELGNSDYVMEIEETISIPEGRHTAKIVDIQIRESIFKGESIKYVDIITELLDLVDKKGNNIQLKLGFPYRMTTQSGLFGFYSKFKLDLKIGDRFDIREIVGKKISYMTFNKQTDKGSFAEIQKDSIII